MSVVGPCLLQGGHLARQYGGEERRGREPEAVKNENKTDKSPATAGNCWGFYRYMVPAVVVFQYEANGICVMSVKNFQSLLASWCLRNKLACAVFASGE